MAEQFCTVNDVELCYETFGDPADPAMLLIMGLATQMVGWHDEFCEQLAARGFFTIRFDNRDIGRSQAMDYPVPTLKQLLLRDKRAARYTLEHMAEDGFGLLDHLGIERAHIAGVSMGGMIAQTMAARHPERVLSLASMLSNTGALWSGQPSPRMYPVLLRAAPRDRASLHRPCRVGVLEDRFAGLPAERPAGDGGHELRPRAEPGGIDAPARRDHRVGRPHAAATHDHGADRRHPRHEGQARAGVGR